MLVLTLVFTFVQSEALSKLFTLSEPQFFHLKRETQLSRCEEMQHRK